MCYKKSSSIVSSTKEIQKEKTRMFQVLLMLLSKCAVRNSKQSILIKKLEVSVLLSQLGFRTPLRKIALLVFIPF